MGFSRFETSVALQVALIVGSCAALAYLAVATSYYATMLLVVAVLILQVAALVRYVRRTNRELARFMLAITHADLAQSFIAQPAGGSFAALARAFEEVMQRLRSAHAATEEQASYLDTVVQHVPVAVIALDETGRVDLFNHAARRLLGTTAPIHLHDFAGFGLEFAPRVLALAPGRSELITVQRDDGVLQLNAAATQLKLRGRSYRIVTLQDIHGELEARELEAWQNLIRVLTHEIMNSATPISSLAATAAELLAEARGGAAHESAIADAHDAVETIAKRSSGLVHFVEEYRRLTRLPKAKLASVTVAELFGRIAQLMGPELERRGVTLEREIAPSHLAFDADADLLEQALINLVRNAMDALVQTRDPRIRLSAKLDAAGNAVIVVADNGHGMEPHVRDNVFVPFFTTKKHGTGVGLSLVRQIMRSHGGHIRVRSAPGAGTAVRLTF
jgi:nitrogen fixation/metabolism regulation signal transduction histidine kinase